MAEKPTVKYLVYYKMPFSDETSLVLRQTIEQVRTLVSCESSRLYWVYEVKALRKRDEMRNMSIDEIL